MKKVSEKNQCKQNLAVNVLARAIKKCKSFLCFDTYKKIYYTENCNLNLLRPIKIYKNSFNTINVLLIYYIKQLV